MVDRQPVPGTGLGDAVVLMTFDDLRAQPRRRDDLVVDWSDFAGTASGPAAYALECVRLLEGGEATLYEVARALWWMSRDEPSCEDEMTVFVGHASDWEELPALRPQIEADIAAALAEAVPRWRSQVAAGS